MGWRDCWTLQLFGVVSLPCVKVCALQTPSGACFAFVARSAPPVGTHISASAQMAACAAPASAKNTVPDQTRTMAVLRLYLHAKVAVLAHDPCFMDAVILHAVAAAEVQQAATNSDLANLQHFVLARSRADEASVSMLRRIDALLVSDESLAYTAPELARFRVLADANTYSPDLRATLR